MQFQAAQYFDIDDRPAGWGIVGTIDLEADWLVDDCDLTEAKAIQAAAALNAQGWLDWHEIDFVIVNRLCQA